MKKHKIIVCDHIDSVRNFVKYALETGLSNIEIEFASNGRNIKRRLEMHHYDLIVYEKEMPMLGGDELLEWLRSHQALKNIPFIMLSTDRQEESLRRAAELGISGYVIKPFTADSLLEKARAALQK